MRKWMSVPATWASVAFVVLSSCSKPEPPPMAYAGPTVSEADLGLLRPVEMPPDGYTLLLGATTLGRDLAGAVATTLATGLTADCTELRIDDETRSLAAIINNFCGSLL